MDPSSLSCPVLVIGADQERMVPASIVRRIADRYGDIATCREFAPLSHWILEKEGWEDVAGYVHHWLVESLTEQREH